MNELDDIKELVKTSLNLADEVARGGVKLTGGPVEFKGLCPFHKEKTPSFTVNTDKRIYHCFGCGEGGDVLDWFMKTKGLDFMGALKLAANQVGMSVPERVYQPANVQAAGQAAPARGPLNPDDYRPLVPGGKVLTYLTEQRKLDTGLLVDYGVGETADGQAYAFSYRWWPPRMARTEGTKARFEFVKVVKVDRPEGKKVEWRQPKGGRNILFGMLAVPSTAEELVIAEGELDAISWAQFGFPAVSVPGGAGYLGWIELCWDWLIRFKKIHISFDEDRAGRAKVVEVIKRLGMARTDIVRLPEKSGGGRYKDANECLVAGVSAEDMARCVAQPEEVRPESLKCIYDFEEEIWRKLHPEGVDQVGLLLPWGNHNGRSLPFRFRYGEVTVWTGFNKHGKSEVLNHCIVDLCWQGDKALICSLEVSAPETYRKLIRMVSGKKEVCSKEEREQFRDRCLKPLANKVWVYDHVGNANIEDVMNVMLYAYQRYGVRQVVLDSLMKFKGLDGDGQDQWNQQRDFMNAVIEFAARYGLHIHLVAHSKKPDKQGEAKIPRRYDISGSAYLSNLPHNVVVIWRNRKKQDDLEELFQRFEEQYVVSRPGKKVPEFKRLLGGQPAASAPSELRVYHNEMLDFVEHDAAKEDGELLQKLTKEHDAYFIVDAQRGGDGDCPARYLWFHYDSLQFLEASPCNILLRPNDPRKRPKAYAEQAVTEMDEVL